MNQIQIVERLEDIVLRSSAGENYSNRNFMIDEVTKLIDELKSETVESQLGGEVVSTNIGSSIASALWSIGSAIGLWTGSSVQNMQPTSTENGDAQSDDQK